MQKELMPQDRLRNARIDAGFSSATAAAKAIGVALGTYSGHENGSRAISNEAAKTYGRHFHVRPAWLLFGELPKTEWPKDMMEHGTTEETLRRVPLDEWDPAAPDPIAPEHGVVTNGDHYHPKLPGARPEIDVRPGAGQGTVGAEVVAITSGGATTGHKVIAEWVMPDAFYRHELHASPTATLIMSVIGDSMFPTLSTGNRAIVDTHQNKFGPDGIYVFDDGDGEPRIKRLSKVLFSDPPEVTIISDNSAHPPQNALLESVRIIGLVVGKICAL
jgi:phage repressor protein C with HTH and peptisase S24 domain